MLTKQDYELALQAGGACNLSGISKTLAEVTSKLFEEKDCTGTAWVNTHPIVILYLDAMLRLAHGSALVGYSSQEDDEDYVDKDGYDAVVVNATHYCQEKVLSLSGAVMLKQAGIENPAIGGMPDSDY